MADDTKSKTKLLDELEKGPWPSFVTEIKKATATHPMCEDLLGQLELSYEEKKGHWKHGGIVGVLGYGGGVIGRYSDVADKFPKVAHFHTLRINQPSGWFYTSEALRTLCDIWERHGSGLTNMHGSTGDIVFLGTKTDELEPTFKELTEAGFDLGGSGSCVRTPSCLRRAGALRVGVLRHHEAVQRPDPDLPGRTAPAAFPLQVQVQVLRLPERLRGFHRPRPTCRSSAPGRTRSSRTTPPWPSMPPRGLDIQKDVCDRCPTQCMDWDGKKLTIDNRECVRCMHCINVMPKALRPGKERAPPS